MEESCFNKRVCYEGRTNVIIRIDNAATDNGKYSAWMFIFLAILTSVACLLLLADKEFC